MSFLYIDKDTEEVMIRPEAIKLPSVKKLYSSDKRPGEVEKPFFKRCLKYIYHMYCNDHPVFKNLGPKERKIRVAETSFSDDTRIEIDNFEKNKKVMAVIEDYLYYQDTLSSKKYRDILRKIDEVSDHIGSIPLKKLHILKDHKVSCMVPAGEDGKMVEKEFSINTKIEVDNSKEYSDSLKLLDQLLEFEEKIKVKLAHEKREVEIHEESMLERNQFDKIKK